MSDPANIIHINANKVSASKVTVIGVGGAGGNAVNNMIQADLAGVDFVVANTDAQALEQSLCNKQIQLGPTVTCGLGAGSHPEVGLAAAEKSLDEIKSVIAGSNVLFITAGMGGGTGTGGAPVVARAAREEDILTVGVVTKPFEFEGPHRMQQAEEGIIELSQFVDTLIVIPNQNLFRIADKNTTFADAFKLADSVLNAGVRCITDVIVLPGLVNIDFADVRAVIAQMGRAVMGTGEAEGDNRAHEAAEAAISNPLLEDDSIAGARNVLINITGGADLLLLEVNEAANRVRAEVNSDANIIFGSAFDERLKGKIRVSVITTGACKERACKSTELKMALKLDNTLVSRNSMMSAADTLQPQTVSPLSRDNSSEDCKRLSQIVANEADDESKDGDGANENIEVGSVTGINEVKAEQRGKLETSSQVASMKTSGEVANSVGTRTSGLLEAEQEERIKTESSRFRHEISSSNIKEEYGVVSEKMSFVVVTDTVGAKIYKIPSEKSALLLEAPYANRLKLHDSLGKAKSTAWNFCEQISSELAGNGSKTGIEKSPCLDFLYWSENEVPNLCS